MKKLFVIGGVIAFIWTLLTGYLICWRLQEGQRIYNNGIVTCSQGATRDFLKYQDDLITFASKNGAVGIKSGDKSIVLYASTPQTAVENQQ